MARNVLRSCTGTLSPLAAFAGFPSTVSLQEAQVTSSRLPQPEFSSYSPSGMRDRRKCPRVWKVVAMSAPTRDRGGYWTDRALAFAQPRELPLSLRFSKPI